MSPPFRGWLPEDSDAIRPAHRRISGGTQKVLSKYLLGGDRVKQLLIYYVPLGFGFCLPSLKLDTGPGTSRGPFPPRPWSSFLLSSRLLQAPGGVRNLLSDSGDLTLENLLSFQLKSHCVPPYISEIRQPPRGHFSRLLFIL